MGVTCCDSPSDSSEDLRNMQQKNTITEAPPSGVYRTKNIKAIKINELIFEYFANLYGRCEPTKLMCAYYDQPFVEIHITGDQWGGFKPQKDRYTFACLPVAVVDGERLGQTRSQQRMIAKRLGCYDINNPMSCY